jgi:hypothetical protein
MGAIMSIPKYVAVEDENDFLSKGIQESHNLLREILMKDVLGRDLTYRINECLIAFEEE